MVRLLLNRRHRLHDLVPRQYGTSAFGYSNLCGALQSWNSDRLVEDVFAWLHCAQGIAMLMPM